MRESINLGRGLIIPIILHLLVIIPIEGLEKLPILACGVTTLFSSIFQQRNSSNYGRAGPGADHSARVLWIKSSQALTRQGYILLSSNKKNNTKFGSIENQYQVFVFLGDWKMSAEHLVEF